MVIRWSLRGQCVVSPWSVGGRSVVREWPVTAMQLPAEQLVSVDIALGRSNGVYRPGDRLTGTVVIDAKQDIPLCGTGLIPSLSTGRCSRLSLRIVAACMPDCLFICLFVYFIRQSTSRKPL